MQAEAIKKALAHYAKAFLRHKTRAPEGTLKAASNHANRDKIFAVVQYL